MLLFTTGLNLNVYGAGLAATLSTWVSCITLIGLMLRRKVLNPADLASPPTKAEVVPYLWKGAVLAFRMVVTFGENTGCSRSMLVPCYAPADVNQHLCKGYETFRCCLHWN
jgi:hypothetical protein